MVGRAPQAQGALGQLQARRRGVQQQVRRAGAAAADGGPPQVQLRPAPRALRVLRAGVRRLQLREAPGQLRFRAALLREQVRHEGAASAAQPAQGRRVRQATGGLPLLPEGVRVRHAVGAPRQVRPLPGGLPAALRDGGAAARGPGGPPQGALQQPAAGLQLQGGRLPLQGQPLLRRAARRAGGQEPLGSGLRPAGQAAAPDRQPEAGPGQALAQLLGHTRLEGERLRGQARRGQGQGGRRARQPALLHQPVRLQAAGLALPQRQRHRRGQPRLHLHQNPARRVRRAAALALLAQRLVHAARSGARRRQGLQHRRELHPRPHLEKLPAAQPRARLARLWLPAFRLPRDDQETPLPQGRHHVHQGQDRPQQDRGGLSSLPPVLSLPVARLGSRFPPPPPPRPTNLCSRAISCSQSILFNFSAPLEKLFKNVEYIKDYRVVYQTALPVLIVTCSIAKGFSKHSVLRGVPM